MIAINVRDISNPHINIDYVTQQETINLMTVPQTPREWALSENACVSKAWTTEELFVISRKSRSVSIESDQSNASQTMNKNVQ